MQDYDRDSWKLDEAREAMSVGLNQEPGNRHERRKQAAILKRLYRRELQQPHIRGKLIEECAGRIVDAWESTDHNCEVGQKEMKAVREQFGEHCFKASMNRAREIRAERSESRA